MSRATLQRAELDELEQPVAILQGGMFAFANTAFLRRVGVPDLAELMAVPLLDLVARTRRQDFKKHLSAAGRLRIGSAETVRTPVSILSKRGEYFEAEAGSRAVEFDGEHCVRLELHVKAPKTLWAHVKARPWALYLSVAFLLLFSTLPPLLITRLDINNSPRVYFPPGSPAVVADDALREIFPSDQVVVIMFDGVALFSDEFLEAIERLEEDLESLPQVEKVLSITTQNHISGSEEGFSVQPLLGSEVREETHPRDRAAIALADPFARGTLIAEDGEALAMIIIPSAAENSLKRLVLMNEIDAAVAAARLTGYVSAVSGEVPADIAQLRSMLHNNLIFIPATTLIGLALIWWLFRRPLAVVAGGVCVGVVTSTTIALYVVFGLPFTMMASITPPLLSALTTASLVHIFSAMSFSAQRGLTGRARVEFAREEVRKPARFCALTTVIGLASLATTPIDPLAQFGLISAAGVTLMYFVVMVLLPQIFIRWDRAPWPVSGGGLPWMDRAVRRCAAIGARYAVYILVITVVALAVGLPRIRDVTVETSIQEFFAPDHPYRRSTDKIEQRLVGTTMLDVSFEVEDVDGLIDPDRLREIDAFEQWAEALPQVDKVISPVDFIREMNWGFHEENPEYRVLPDDPKLISQFLFIYDGDELGDFLDDDRRVARLSFNLNVHKATEIRAVIDKMRVYLGANITTGTKWDIAGIGRLFADYEDLLVGGQVSSISGSIVMIFVMMAWLWRSIGESVLTMIPNLIPIVMIFVYMGVSGIWLDFATVMVGSVTAGIAVDDTIHIYHGFRERIRRGITPAAALMRTYGQTGRAVIVTTTILASQFLVMLASDFRPFARFGELTALGLAAALVFELFVTPALLIAVYGRAPDSRVDRVRQWAPRRLHPPGTSAPPLDAAGPDVSAAAGLALRPKPRASGPLQRDPMPADHRQSALRDEPRQSAEREWRRSGR